MMHNIKLESTVLCDATTSQISALFDYKWDGTSHTEIHDFVCPAEFKLGVIVGPSGSGKSTLLRRKFTLKEFPVWEPQKAVVSHFNDSTDAINRLGSVGFNSIPAWLRPFHHLSCGEQFRANVARMLSTGAAIDEYTSTVDRTVARSCSIALRKYLNKSGVSQVVLATCHYDVIKWLCPDWVYDTRTSTLYTGRWQSPPKLIVDVFPCSQGIWEQFKTHHYLSGSLNKSAKCWLAVLGDTPVGFASAIAFPNGNFKKAWREHRTVVLPEFQGCGIGMRLSDYVASLFVTDGCRYFSKTAHPRMGWHRNNSVLWRATTKNMSSRPDYGVMRQTKEAKYSHLHRDRFCFSHEYVGSL